MRQLDRMRIGMALAGLLFCMTSTALAMSTGRKTTHAADDVITLAKACHVDLVDDASLQCFQTRDARVPSLILRHNQGDEYKRVATAISNAKAVPGGHGTPVQTIVFYEQTGQVDKLFYVTDTRLLFDPMSHRYFRLDSTVQKLLAKHTL